MKSTFVRAIVLTLTVAGLAAPSMTSAKTPAKAPSTTTAWSGYPTPLCMPGTGDYCGLQ